MAWTVERVNAKTRNGLFAQFVKYDDFYWPCPWVFSVEGKEHGYSLGGFVGNHTLPQHDLDIIAPWHVVADFTEVERQFLSEKLAGTNSQIGQEILEKLAALSAST